MEALELNLLVVYLMLATVLVFIMHAGFGMLEAGFTRAKNAANILMKNLMTVSLGMVVYYAVGFGLMYGTQIAGLAGTDYFFLVGAGYEPDVLLEMDFAFQAMFAATAATIVSGAMAERMRIGSYMVFAAAMTAVIYPIVGAWTWGGGWLDQLGFVDFAGSTIVHLTGGMAALVGAAMLGARIGKFGRDGRPRAIPGHSMPLGMLGVLLLWFGWFGFNGGSVLVLDGQAIASVLVTTTLAAAAGGVAAGLYTRLRYGKFDVTMSANGVLAGLVAITAGADVVANPLAVLIGALAGVLVVLSVAAIDALRIDDPVGAVSVHGTCGVLGTLWVGIAHLDQGLLYGGGLELLGIQALGVLAVIAWVAVSSAIVFGLVRITLGLRVSEEEEIEGLDLGEHGVYGYPELALGAQAFPGGPVTQADGTIKDTRREPANA